MLVFHCCLPGRSPVFGTIPQSLCPCHEAQGAGSTGAGSLSEEGGREALGQGASAHGEQTALSLPRHWVLALGMAAGEYLAEKPGKSWQAQRSSPLGLSREMCPRQARAGMSGTTAGNRDGKSDRLQRSACRGSGTRSINGSGESRRHQCKEPDRQGAPTGWGNGNT